MLKEIVCENFYIKNGQVLPASQAKAQVAEAVKNRLELRCKKRAGTLLTSKYVKDMCLTYKCRTCPFLKPD